MSPEAKSGPVALVTGANKGIGLEVVRRLVQSGYTVYLGARNAELGTLAADTVAAHFIHIDVTSQQSVSSAAKTVNTREGHLDLLVNNAGVTGPVREVEDYTAEDLESVLATNVVGYVRVIQAFLPLLKISHDPRIINVGSGLGSFTLFHDEDRTESTVPAMFYAASKAAINMLTVRYAKLLPDMRINVADPGMTATDLNDGQGHSVREGSDAIIALALEAPGGASGSYQDRDGELPF